MKKLILFSFLACCIACTTPKNDTQKPEPELEPQVGSYAYGADCSWITEQEADGVIFRDSLGNPADGMLVMREAGMNAIRLRVWVNHSTGWCNKEDVIIKAKRAAALRLRVMIDFHYSDYFADPSHQSIPTAWETYDLEQMKQAVADHTVDVLTALKNEGVTPEWVQVGNETTTGMLWPMGQLWDENGGETPNGWKNYAQLITAGYDACKSVFPETTVIVHVDNAYQDKVWYFNKLKNLGGKFDMIGLSHYPMMKQWSGKDWDEMNTLAAENIQALHKAFQCPIMVVEIGTKAASEMQAKQVIEDFRQRVDTLDYMKGIFYWEPQVFNAWKPQEYNLVGWGAYDMGAFTSKGQPNEALKTLWKR